MDDRFKIAFGKLLQVEGGYVDDPDDTGGKTRYGVTEAVARKHGYTGDMRNLPLDLARNIYSSDYWNAIGLDKIVGDDLCHELFDSAVNVGTDRAATWLQECLNVLNNNERRWSDVLVDKFVGAKTIKAANDACAVPQWEKRLVKLLNCVQGNFYKELCEKRPKSQKFLGGWLDHRVVI